MSKPSTVLYSKMVNGRLEYVENAEYKEYCEKNKNYNGSIWSIVHKTTKERTLPQNSAMHLYFEHVAQALNAAGYSVKLVLEQKMDIDWNSETVKELLWRPAQKRITKKKSTTKLDKLSEIDLIYDHLNRHLGQKFGIYVPFPNDPNKDIHRISPQS